ncbi:MAG: hypothetical protein NC092_12955, partial [Butyrivibrio sp.]|nr:hypothetical protein [Butyrivibrio sp.]
LGYFYVTSDEIWLLRGEDVLSHIETKDDIISPGTVICAKEGTEDKLGDEKGWHEYLEIREDSCIYHGWNDKVETGFYERFVWKMGEGLVCYISGYGAMRSHLEIYIGERGEWD